jgi:hypothetical protein
MVQEPMDFMPFSGLNPGSSRIFIHSGDSGQGITNGVAGSLTIMPLIIGEDSRFAPVLDPKRKSFTSTASIGEFIREQAGAVKNFAEYIGPGDVKSEDDLQPGEGAIIRHGLKQVATYKARTAP